MQTCSGLYEADFGLNNDATFWHAVWQATYAFMTDDMLCTFVTQILLHMITAAALC